MLGSLDRLQRPTWNLKRYRAWLHHRGTTVRATPRRRRCRAFSAGFTPKEQRTENPRNRGGATMAAQQPSFGQIQPRSPASLTEIDISGPARALKVLRWTDYTLVVVCGVAVLGLLPDLISSGARGRWSELVVQGLMTAALAFAAFTGWRHVGVIDPRVWRSYLWVLPGAGELRPSGRAWNSFRFDCEPPKPA